MTLYRSIGKTEYELIAQSDFSLIHPDYQNNLYSILCQMNGMPGKLQKSRIVGTPQMENILLRKCTSDITAGRAVLYRVMRKFKKFSLKTHFAFLSFSFFLNTNQ